ncbi:hypothetical protein NDU88_000040 [Pleurodeles waltl]|uniref:Uncharacterized protein n=1 Tax=Pleurodeles waltl TaxID=8319 RepID=A0AAV7USB5_PLEWA|nr:hypothetical protein NDU88_000040 [Pleurodeles waltl]
MKKKSRRSTNGATSSGKDLKWDYSDSPLHGENVAGSKEDGLSHRHTATLEIIYQSIMADHKKTRADSHRAQTASLNLQGTICKLTKTCTKLLERMTKFENRVAVLENEVMAQMKLCEATETHLTDTHWKLEKLGNRFRHNNLRVLGIAEGLEGSDTRKYIVKLFNTAFSDLPNQNWDIEEPLTDS